MLLSVWPAIVGKQILIFLIIKCRFIRLHSDVLEWHKPRAATVTLVKVKGWLLDMAGGKLTNIYHRLAREEGILLHPSSAFAIDDVYFRFGYGRKSMTQGLAALDKVLNKWRPKLNAKL